MVAGPWPSPTSATASSGTDRPELPCTASVSSAPRSPRSAGSTCTRIGISRSPSRNLARLAEMSPIVAMRTASLIASVEMPNRAASSPARGHADFRPVRAGGGGDVAEARQPAHGALELGLGLAQRHRVGAEQRQRQLALAAVVHIPAAHVGDAGEDLASARVSICFCVRRRSLLCTRLTIILARRISAPAPVGVVPPTTNTVVTSGTLRNAAAMRSVVAPRVLELGARRQLDRQHRPAIRPAAG